MKFICITTVALFLCASFGYAQQQMLFKQKLASSACEVGASGTGLNEDLVSVLELEETTGSTLADATGQGNTVTFYNGITSTTGVVGSGNAIDFNGSSDYGLFGTWVELTGDFSISMWVNPDSWDSWYEGLFGRVIYPNRSDIVGVSIGTNTGQNRLDFYIYGGTTNGSAHMRYDLSETLSPSGGWYHIVMTWDESANEIAVYIDGSTSNGTLYSGYVNPRTEASVLAWTTNTAYRIVLGGNRQPYGTINEFDGQMDQVAIWNKVLTQSEINSLYNSGNGLTYDCDTWASAGAAGDCTDCLAGLVSVWELQETSGTTVGDAANNQDLTNSGATVNTTAGTMPSNFSSSYDFNGSSDYLTNNGNSDADFDFDFNDAYSLSAWVYCDAMGTSGYNIIISKMAASGINANTGWFLYWRSDDKAQVIHRYVSGVTYGIAGRSTAMNKGEWNHIVFTYNGGGDPATDMKFYINGASVSVTEVLDNELGSSLNDEEVTVGARNEGENGEFDGHILQVGVWSKELTATEATNLYNNGDGLPYSSW